VLLGMNIIVEKKKCQLKLVIPFNLLSAEKEKPKISAELRCRPAFASGANFKREDHLTETSQW
jgi:hypothetical protein